MADVDIRDTTVKDVAVLAARMRASDRREVAAYGHTDVMRAVTSSVANSVLCWSAFIDDELAAILGAAPLSVMGGVGSPWMLGTDVLTRHSRVLVSQTPAYIDRMLVAFPHLLNFVHAENTTSVRWLRRLGFTIHPAMPFGELGAPFHKFEMRA